LDVGWHSEAGAKDLTNRYRGGEEIISCSRFASRRLPITVVSVPNQQVMKWRWSSLHSRCRR